MLNRYMYCIDIYALQNTTNRYSYVYKIPSDGHPQERTFNKSKQHFLLHVISWSSMIFMECLPIIRELKTILLFFSIQWENL